jgi:hypothetical protein
MWYENEYMHVVYKLVLQGGFSALISGSLWGFQQGVNFSNGNRMNLMMYSFVAGAVGSVLTDVVGKLLYMEMYVGEKAEDMTINTINMIISGAVYTGILLWKEPVSAKQMGSVYTFLIGSVSEYASNLVNSYIPIQ